MSEIPKRPIFALYTDDATADLWLVHEHAVAKRAVEALRPMCARGHDMDTCDLLRHGGDCTCGYAKARAALAEIEASGWRP